MHLSDHWETWSPATSGSLQRHRTQVSPSTPHLPTKHSHKAHTQHSSYSADSQLPTNPVSSLLSSRSDPFQLPIGKARPDPSRHSCHLATEREALPILRDEPASQFIFNCLFWHCLEPRLSGKGLKRTVFSSVPTSSPAVCLRKELLFHTDHHLCKAHSFRFLSTRVLASTPS